MKENWENWLSDYFKMMLKEVINIEWFDYFSKLNYWQGKKNLKYIYTSQTQSNNLY